MNKIHLYIFLVLFIISCSQSGRRQKKDNLKPTNTKVKVEELPVNTDISIVPVNKLNNPSTKSLSELYKEIAPSVFLILTSDETVTQQGTGFFIEPKIGISNYHVFKGSTKGLETIITSNGDEYKIESVLEYSEEKDYIIFRLAECYSNSFINIANSLPEIGDEVFAIGNPKGLDHTLSTGIVSSYRDNNNIIQTTTEITHGSSGGPLLNMDGEVIGITTSGVGEANLNFALNINTFPYFQSGKKKIQ